MRFPESPQWLFVTDVDDTLTGDWPSLLEFSKVGSPLLLVLNSSRPHRSVCGTLETLPADLRIDGLVTALGTEIEIAGTPCAEWAERFAEWDRAAVDALLESVGFSPHPAGMQTPCKASYAVPRNRWDEMRARIFEHVPDTQVITSGESDFDVIPRAAGKGAATLHVAAALGIDRDRLIVAGDSGNDLSLFAVADRAIAVGNARPELIEAADPAHTYFARAHSAAGLLEGLRHWGALPPAETCYG